MCRWEGTPATNIKVNDAVMVCTGPRTPCSCLDICALCSVAQVIQNTVIDSPYVADASQPPAINVYAGLPNINATSPVNEGVDIRGNLVIRGLVRFARVTACCKAVSLSGMQLMFQ